MRPLDIGIAVSYCFKLYLFLHLMANLFFFSFFDIECFYIPLMRPNKIKTGCGYWHDVINSMMLVIIFE